MKEVFRLLGYALPVQLRDVALSESEKRYADARVEVQVASVLMHAWSEVEHDLVYKPLQGALSTEEYAILDELNGLVMAGEIALERLQKAGEKRIADAGHAFSDQYDLTTFLLSRMPSEAGSYSADAALGRVDMLYDFLQKVGICEAQRHRTIYQEPPLGTWKSVRLPSRSWTSSY